MNENRYSDKEWQFLDDEIQKRFRALAAQIQTAVPCLNPRFGKTVTKLFPLFSHVSFRPTEAGECEDIIVGVDIASHDGQWRIDADVSEEESGNIYFELPNAAFSVSSFQELTEHVLHAVEQLTIGAKPVLLRRLVSSSPVMPSQNTTTPTLNGTQTRH